jgi:hypothetical protein
MQTSVKIKKERSLEDKWRICEMLIVKFKYDIFYHVGMLQHNYNFYISWFNTNLISKTHEIKFRIAIAKAAFNKNTLFHKQIGLKFK